MKTRAAVSVAAAASPTAAELAKLVWTYPDGENIDGINCYDLDLDVNPCDDEKVRGQGGRWFLYWSISARH